MKTKGYIKYIDFLGKTHTREVVMLSQCGQGYELVGLDEDNNLESILYYQSNTKTWFIPDDPSVNMWKEFTGHVLEFEFKYFI